MFASVPPSFNVALGDGLEAFLIPALALSLLRKKRQFPLLAALAGGIAGGFIASFGLGYFFWMNQGVGLAMGSAVLSGLTALWLLSFGVRVRENRGWAYFFFLSVWAVSREGMETVVLFLQVRGTPSLAWGIVLGSGMALVAAWFWQELASRAREKTLIFLASLFFILAGIQFAVQSFHEFTEAGIFPRSEFLHEASEPFSAEGRYGRGFLNGIFLFTTLGFALDRLTGRWRREP